MSVDVHAYLSYRQFLSDWFDAHKARHPHFSHRAFVRRIGARSAGLVSNVIAGRRNLSDAMAERIAGAMKLDDASHHFFLLLVDFEQAETDAQQAAAWRRIAVVRRFRSARSMDASVLDVFSRWTHLATYELSRVRGFQAHAGGRPIVTSGLPSQPTSVYVGNPVGVDGPSLVAPCEPFWRVWIDWLPPGWPTTSRG